MATDRTPMTMGTTTTTRTRIRISQGATATIIHTKSKCCRRNHGALRSSAPRTRVSYQRAHAEINGMIIPLASKRNAQRQLRGVRRTGAITTSAAALRRRAAKPGSKHSADVKQKACWSGVTQSGQRCASAAASRMVASPMSPTAQRWPASRAIAATANVAAASGPCSVRANGIAASAAASELPPSTRSLSRSLASAIVRARFLGWSAYAIAMSSIVTIVTIFYVLASNCIKMRTIWNMPLKLLVVLCDEIRVH